MAKIYFRYGVVGSAKTLNLLAVSHNYRQQKKKIILFGVKRDMVKIKVTGKDLGQVGTGITMRNLEYRKI